MLADQLIELLKLKPHPEGGYYSETYRSSLKVMGAKGLERSASTAIYFMLKEGVISHFHQVHADEMWFFHKGHPIEVIMINPLGQLETVVLGEDLHEGQSFQLLVPAYTWFAARMLHNQGFGLVSCVVAPGFDFQDFILADKIQLTAQYPHLADPLEQLCIEV
jgi:uncharacterized protein